MTASLSGVFTAALYEYATTKKVPEGFSKEHIAGAFGHKEGRMIGRRESPIV